MSVVAWILVGLAVFAICLLGFIIKRMRQADYLQRRADWSKVKPWDDEEDDDDWGQPPAPPGTPPR